MYENGSSLDRYKAWKSANPLKHPVTLGCKNLTATISELIKKILLFPNNHSP